MGRATTYGAAPKPDADTYADFKDCGRHLADMAKNAKSSRTSVNLKGKIESYIRKAINSGMDVFEGSHHDFDRPSKAEVTKWVKLRATKVMGSTSSYRRNNQMWEFGSAVTRELVSAFKKGWSLGAGTAILNSPAGKETSAELRLHIPRKYESDWQSMCLRKTREETVGIYSHPDARRVVYQEDVCPRSGDSSWRAVFLCSECNPELRIFFRDIEDPLRIYSPISGPCMKALMNAGLVQYAITLPAVRVIDLTEESMDLYLRLLMLDRAEQISYRNSAAGRERRNEYNAALARLGRPPVSDQMIDEYEIEKINYAINWNKKMETLKKGLS